MAKKKLDYKDSFMKEHVEKAEAKMKHDLSEKKFEEYPKMVDGVIVHDKEEEDKLKKESKKKESKK